MHTNGGGIAGIRRSLDACGGSLQLALATWVRASAADILQAGGVFTFFGVQGGKKTIKLQEAFWMSFWQLFGGFLLFFWCFRGAKNCGIYGAFAPGILKKRGKPIYWTIFAHYEIEKKAAGVTPTNQPASQQAN